MSKYTRNGGKFSKHTTFIPTGSELADIAEGISEVNRVICGKIYGGLKSASVSRRVKIITESRGCILLRVRDGTSCQDIRIFTKNTETTRTTLVVKIRKAGITIASNKSEK